MKKKINEIYIQLQQVKENLMYLCDLRSMQGEGQATGIHIRDSIQYTIGIERHFEIRGLASCTTNPQHPYCGYNMQ